jgi:phage terminase small subunit
MALSAKHRAFVKEYLKDKNATRAYKSVYGNVAGAAQHGARLIRNDKVSKAIEAGLAAQAAAADVTAQELVEFFAGVMRSKKIRAKTGDRIKAAELLGKRFGMFKDVQENINTDGGPVCFLRMPANGSESPDYPSPANPEGPVKTDKEDKAE